MNKLDIYTTNEIDNDGSLYRRKRSEVLSYRHGISEDIDQIIAKYEPLMQGGLYIKWNWLYFTYQGAKYYEKISHFEGEWWHINELMEELSRHAQDIAYEYGTLD